MLVAPLHRRAGDFFIRGFFRGPERSNDEEHHAEGNGHVSDIENRGAKIADAEIEKINHASVAKDAVNEIAHAAGKDETEREQMQAITIIRAYDVYEQKREADARAKNKKQHANVLGQLGTEAEGDTGIFGVMKTEQVGEEGLRTVVLQKGFSPMFRDLVATDTSDRSEE